MLGRDATRNPVSPEMNAPIQWDVESGRNIKWSARMGSQTYGTPVVAGGQVYVGTNNAAGYLKRYPRTVDLGCLLCFREADGEFLWQYSAEKLPSGRRHDWPLQGLGSSPLVEGERMWFVNNRWEVICADTRGFRDGENDGPYMDERVEDAREADVVWMFDLMDELGVRPLPAGMGPDRRCSIAVSYKDRIYVVTGNGVDISRTNIPAPDAPSLVCFHKETGKVLWSDNSPGKNILHTQIASPLVAEIAGRGQVIVPQGDGWIRSFDALTGNLIWKFDINFKESKWILGGRGSRNNILATPVLYENRIYIASGQEAEHGEGMGRLVCIDPTNNGDISSELAVDKEGNVIAHRRLQAVDPSKGEKAIPNPNSGLVWEFGAKTQAQYRNQEFEQQMHRTVSSVAVHKGLLIVADFSGLVHCLDAKTGKQYWTYDALSAMFAAPLIVDGKVYVADEDGDVAVFRLSADPDVAMKKVSGEHRPIAKINMGNSVHCSPIFANGTLYIVPRTTLHAIQSATRTEKTSKPTRTDKTRARRTPRAVFTPTPQDVVEKMLELAAVKKGNVVYDLGSGDGRILITAATKYGCKAVGYEIDPELVKLSRKQVQKANLKSLVTIHQADLFNADLSNADVVTLYLLPVQNKKLIPRLKKLKAGSRIVAHEFPLPGFAADKKVKIESKESGEKHTLYLWTAPLKTSRK